MSDDGEVVILDDKGAEHVFPAGFDPQRAASIVRGDGASHPSDSTSLIPASVAPAANALARFGTNPNAPKVAGQLVRVATEVGAPIAGAVHSGLPGLAEGALAGQLAGFRAGRSGYWLTQRLQGAARPVASALEAAKPFADRLTLAQGPLDLAQMAEPNRKDIGFLGVGGGTPDPAHPALLNAIYDAVRKRLQSQP